MPQPHQPDELVDGILFTYRRTDGRLVDVFVPGALASQARSAAGPIRGPSRGYMQIHDLEVVEFDDERPEEPELLEVAVDVDENGDLRT